MNLAILTKLVERELKALLEVHDWPKNRTDYDKGYRDGYETAMNRVHLWITKGLVEIEKEAAE